MEIVIPGGMANKGKLARKKNLKKATYERIMILIRSTSDLLIYDNKCYKAKIITTLE